MAVFPMFLLLVCCFHLAYCASDYKINSLSCHSLNKTVLEVNVCEASDYYMSLEYNFKQPLNQFTVRMFRINLWFA